MTPETINGRNNSKGPVAQHSYIALKSSIYLDSFIEKKKTLHNSILELFETKFVSIKINLLKRNLYSLVQRISSTGASSF